MKKLLVIFLIITTIVQFSSCKKVDDDETVITGLSVTCTSYPEMTVMPIYEPTVSELQNTMFPTIYKYSGHRCHVAIENGNVVVSDKFVKDTVNIFKGNCGYFVGVDNGEFGGWCKYYEYGSAECTTFSENNCYGLLSSGLDTGYLIAKKPNSATTYVARLTRGSEWKSKAIASFDGAPRCYAHSEENNVLYVATDVALMKISLGNGQVTELSVPKYWSYLFPETMVVHGDKLLLGAVTGVFEYDLSTDSTAFYRMEYEKYLSE